MSQFPPSLPLYCFVCKLYSTFSFTLSLSFPLPPLPFLPLLPPFSPLSPISYFNDIYTEAQGYPLLLHFIVITSLHCLFPPHRCLINHTHPMRPRPLAPGLNHRTCLCLVLYYITHYFTIYCIIIIIYMYIRQMCYNFLNVTLTSAHGLLRTRVATYTI